MRFSVQILCVLCVASAIATETADEEKKSILSGGNKPFGIFGNKDKDQDSDSFVSAPAECEIKSIGRSFRQYNLVPEFIPYSPDDYLEVDLTGNKDRPCLGDTANVCDTLNAPVSLKWDCDSSKRYTLFFIDVYPLGISRPDGLAQGILWWVVDIPGCNVNSGTTLYQYQLPLPLYASGIDRYVYLIYEQPDYKIDWSEEPLVSATSQSFRFFKCVDKLANKYQLKLVAGNFFTSEFDPCIEPGLSGLDPVPQYVSKAIEAANLLKDPFATSKSLGN